MSKLRATNIEPQSATTLTLGASGDSALVSSDSIKNNTWQDVGGNTLFQSDGAGTVSNINAGLAGGGFTLISSTPHTNVAVSNIGGMSSAYDEYWWVFTNIHAIGNDDAFRWQATIDDFANWGINITSAAAYVYNFENTASEGGPDFLTGSFSLQNNVGPQWLFEGMGNSAASVGGGIMKVYRPGSTTIAKQWEFDGTYRRHNPRCDRVKLGGYINTTSAVQGFRFSMANANWSGTIKLYGVG